MRFFSVGLCLLTVGLSSALAQINPARENKTDSTDSRHESEWLARGQALTQAAGCISCHTNRPEKGSINSGRRKIETDFGVFYSANITPDIETGIGQMSEAEFLAAMRKGQRPDGKLYYPVFPYRSYTKMTDQDLLAIRAYLMSLPAVKQVNRKHEIRLPFRLRSSLRVWQAMNLPEPQDVAEIDIKIAAGVFKGDPTRSASWNRGAYLVEAVTHCSECHTPRNSLGGLKVDQWMSGVVNEQGVYRVPNITPDQATGTGRWSQSDWIEFFESGMTPNGDIMGGKMAEVIEGLKGLSQQDLSSMAEYLMSLRSVASPFVRPQVQPQP